MVQFFKLHMIKYALLLLIELKVYVCRMKTLCSTFETPVHV